jgi:hypothetical protein
MNRKICQQQTLRIRKGARNQMKARQSYDRVAKAPETINKNPVDGRAFGRGYWLDFVADLIRLSSIPPQIATSNIGVWMSTPFMRGVVDALAVSLYFWEISRLSQSYHRLD